MKWSILLGLFIWTVLLTAYCDFQGGDSMAVNQTPVQYKRLFIDVPTSVNDTLVAEAQARGMSKKALVESLILDMASKPVTKKKRDK